MLERYAGNPADIGATPFTLAAVTTIAAAVRLVRAPQWRWLWKITVGLMAIVAAWSVATPPSGGVDEPDHVIRAAAAARLDFAGTAVVSVLGEATRHYDVPLALEGPDIVCWARHPDDQRGMQHVAGGIVGPRRRCRTATTRRRTSC